MGILKTRSFSKSLCSPFVLLVVALLVVAFSPARAPVTEAAHIQTGSSRLRSLAILVVRNPIAGEHFSRAGLLKILGGLGLLAVAVHS